MTVVVLLVLLLLLVGTAVCGALTLRLESLASFGLAVYVLAAGEVLVLAEVLSLFGAIGRAGYAVGEALLALAAAAAWVLRGRPRWPGIPAVPWRALPRAHPWLVGLAVVVALALVYEAVLAVAVPPNNFDGLSYHLTRAAEWYQRQRVEYVEPTPTEHVNLFPPNGELEILYTFVLLGRDTLAAAPQLLAEVALIGGVYGVARRLGAPRAAAAYAGLVFGTLSDVALQATSTQNDLVTASFFVAAVFFAWGGSRTELSLGALALALAVGTKWTALLLIPWFAVLVLLTLPRRRILEFTGLAVCAFVLVGAYSYVLNLAETHNPLGRYHNELDAGFIPARSPGNVVSTAARFTYGFADFSGYHLGPAWLGWMETWGRNLFAALHIAANPPGGTYAITPFSFVPYDHVYEDSSYFGPLGAFLLLPLALVFVGAFIARRTDRRRALVAVALPFFIVGLAGTVRYHWWAGRSMAIAVALTCALVAFLYARRLFVPAITFVACLTLLFAHLFNPGKPVGLDGSTPFWDKSYAENVSGLGPGFTDVAQAVEAIPANARVGAARLLPTDFSYPLFGKRLDRDVVFLVSDDPLAEANRLRICWVVGHTQESAAGWEIRTMGAPPWQVGASKRCPAAVASLART